MIVILFTFSCANFSLSNIKILLLIKKFSSRLKLFTPNPRRVFYSLRKGKKLLLPECSVYNT